MVANSHQNGTRVLRALLMQLNSSNSSNRAMSLMMTKRTQRAPLLSSLPCCPKGSPQLVPSLSTTRTTAVAGGGGGGGWARNSTDCLYFHHGYFDSFHPQRRFVSTPTTALWQRTMDPENESFNTSHHASHDMDHEFPNNDTTVTYDTIQRLLQGLRSENYQPSRACTLRRVEENGTVTEISTRDWIHQQARQNAALRQWLVATPHGVRHLCDCLHYDFVWNDPTLPVHNEDSDPAVSP
jgi:hypothetical protein